MPPPTRNVPEEEPAIPIDPMTAKTRSIFLKENVAKVQALKAEGKTKEEIQAKLLSFVMDYPSLFKMLMNTDSYNEGSLRTMLAMLEKMGNSELDQNQASVIVGQRLHDVYIKPKMEHMVRKD
jgi:hypothetical protein